MGTGRYENREMSQRPSVIVIFRNDDVSACSNLEIEEQVAGIFERYNVPQTIGVVPLWADGDHHQYTQTRKVSLSENKAIVNLLLRHVERTGSEIALHGYTHRTNRWSYPHRREYFEFRRYSANDQEWMIRQGTEILQSQLGVSPTTFIPPWNRFDENTCIACRNTGYTILSGGPFTPTQPPLVGLGTDCCLAELPGRLQRSITSKHMVIIRVLYHSGHLTTAQRMRELEDTVGLASQTSGCQVMTLNDVVKLYLQDTILANEVARNIVDPSEVPSSIRASSVFYLRMLQRVWPRSSLDRLRQEAFELYEIGDYQQILAISPKIDRASWRLAWTCRILVAAGGLVVGLFLSCASTGFATITRFGLYSIFAIVIVLLGSVVRWFATASDTRCEVLRFFFLGLIGFIFGLAIGELT